MSAISSEDGQALKSEPASEHDAFDDVLRELARPPRLARKLAESVLARSPTTLDVQPLQRALDPAQHESSEPSVGDILEGRYRIVRVLGRGGMGVVLEAENQRTGKHVAIKWLSAERAFRSATMLARFQREARAVAKIHHENVVDVYDVGESNGTPFLVMERLEGESLRARIQRGAVPWSEAREIFSGVLRGVIAIHRAGVVHRDLKPDNIFLCRVEGKTTPLPKVLDFGVAAMREGPDDGFGSLTRTGGIVGTPSYMAYEQLTGAKVDTRADVYALGVVLYEMLSQRLPFAARTSAEVAVLQATSAPERLSAPSARGEAEQVVLRALAQKPERRHASAEDFLRALEAASADNVWRKRGLLLLIAASALLGGTTYAVLRQPAQSPLAPSVVRVDEASPSSSVPEVVAPSPAAEAALSAEVVEAPVLPTERSDAPKSQSALPRPRQDAREKSAVKRGTPAQASLEQVDHTRITLDDF